MRRLVRAVIPGERRCSAHARSMRHKIAQVERAAARSVISPSVNDPGARRGDQRLPTAEPSSKEQTMNIDDNERTALELRSLLKSSGELELSLAEVAVPRPAADDVLV